MRNWLAAALAGAAVGVAIVAAGGASHPEVVALAIIGALTFADLTRRGLRERRARRGDPTDVWMSVAFAAILVGGAWDVGRGMTGALPPWLTAAGRLAGVVLIVAGVWLRHTAARALGENFLVRLGVREGHTLVRSGPYRWIRHPTYAALLAVAIGTSAALASIVALIATVGLWLPVVFTRMAREERILIGEFGEEYREYMSRTWRMVPGVL